MLKVITMLLIVLLSYFMHGYADDTSCTAWNAWSSSDAGSLGKFYTISY